MASAVAFSGSSNVVGGSQRLPPLRRSHTTHSTSSLHSQRSPRSPRSPPTSPGHRSLHQQQSPLLLRTKNVESLAAATSSGSSGCGSVGAGLEKGGEAAAAVAVPGGRPSFGVMDKGMRTIPGKIFWKGKYIDQSLFYQVRDTRGVFSILRINVWVVFVVLS